MLFIYLFENCNNYVSSFAFSNLNFYVRWDNIIYYENYIEIIYVFFLESYL